MSERFGSSITPTRYLYSTTCSTTRTSLTNLASCISLYGWYLGRLIGLAYHIRFMLYHGYRERKHVFHTCKCFFTFSHYLLFVFFNLTYLLTNEFTRFLNRISWKSSNKNSMEHVLLKINNEISLSLHRSELDDLRTR